MSKPPLNSRVIAKWHKLHDRKYDVQWRGVVKVQRSLFTSEHVPQVLIYSKDRSVHYAGDMDDMIAGWFGEPGEQDENKFFATAELRGTVVHIIRKVSWRDW